MQRQWTGRAGQAGAAVRIGAALGLVFSLLYSPIHLNLEPHFDDADFGSPAAAAWATALVGEESHDGDGHHERHPAAHHKFKGVSSERLVVVEMLVVPAVEWMDAEKDCPQPPVFGFSGLSPPELPHGWQFLFRAALPVRAPSLLS
ncbi:MAG: hypothetical protein HZA90_02115 [Verrucomicrobia bacterium]|nr:hypothetical protein [Verrucomicrobiota bacterium]